MVSKFNVKDNRKVGGTSPGVIHTSNTPTGTTYEGAPGYAYSGKSELFLLATTGFFGQDKFYEKADESSKRFIKLVQEITATDPVWMLNFITWLRRSGNMRTGAVVASVEAALVAKKDGQPGHHEGMGRQLTKAGIARADEIGEALGYYQHAYPGKLIAKPIKRGVADALADPKIVNEYAAMKYKGDGKAWTLGQVINMVRPTPRAPWQADLFGYLVAREYGEVEIPRSLIKLGLRDRLMKAPVEQRRAIVQDPNAGSVLKDAGMTWEALAGWLQGPMDKAAWKAIIPSMGYMALLRNLRNFDEAGVSNDVAALVGAKLADAEEVKRSKQFPFRILAAHRAAPHIRWGSPLAQALEHSVANVPGLPGRTLVLVDTSGSMNSAFSEHSELKRWDAAALFGIALAKAAERVQGAHVDIVSYSNNAKVFQPKLGADLLSECQRWVREGYNLNGGTNTAGTVAACYRKHDRVIILTDEQTHYATSVVSRGFSGGYYNQYAVDASVPADKHMFTFNLAGYKQGHLPTGSFRHSFGGLTDASFKLIEMIERAGKGAWPWEVGQ